ncbi:MAG: transglutaminase family protein [Leptolyngbyaceae cyanobacterium SL_7_1]|nr:transglutaminase family protein [Leptolyngbyaceae cyanobacterium SL_7_1]
MLYEISHNTTYRYARPVALAPHVVRSRPRSDVAQSLRSFSLTIIPEPVRSSENIDLDGNAVIKVWFSEEAIEELTVIATAQMETHRTNPFDFLLEPWAATLPIDYPTSLLVQLQPYLTALGVGSIDPIATQLAQEIWYKTDGNTVEFLSTLNQQIAGSCQYQLRETGAPLPAGITWTQKAGSCRDLSVLFMEACRAIGLAARFVSGYYEPDPGNPPYLHAWVEVYLPGAGWRGYDPTQGLATADRHVALVASPIASHTLPITGELKSGVGTPSEMRYEVAIERLTV